MSQKVEYGLVFNKDGSQPASPSVLPRHTVDVRGHRLQSTSPSPLKPRMTAPVNRNPIPSSIEEVPPTEESDHSSL